VAGGEKDGGGMGLLRSGKSNRELAPMESAKKGRKGYVPQRDQESLWRPDRDKSIHTAVKKAEYEERLSRQKKANCTLPG